jgi:hypothetical protein
MHRLKEKNPAPSSRSCMRGACRRRWGIGSTLPCFDMLSRAQAQEGAPRCFFGWANAIWWEHPGAGGRTGLWAVFSPHWPWWAPGGGSHQMGWSGEARGSRGGAPGGARCGADLWPTPLAFAPGRWAGGAFFFGDKWLDRTGRVCRSWVPQIFRKPPPGASLPGIAFIRDYSANRLVM